MLTIKKALAAIGATKRSGLHIARPVMNAQEWFDWATAAGIPEPLPAAEMHITVLYSTVDVKVKPIDDAMVIDCEGWCPAVIAALGPDADSLCVCFDSWPLMDRNWALRDAGAMSTWPSYRPHMTLSNAAAGFEISDEALGDMPRFIVLGGEVFDDLKPPAGTDVEDDGESDALETAEMEVEARKAVAKILEKKADLDPLDSAAAWEIAHGKPITKAALRRLRKATWAPDLLKDVMAKTDARGLKPKMAEKAIQVTISQLPSELAKKLGGAVSKTFNEEKRLVYGIANASTVGGELVSDLDGDSFTVDALREWLHKALKDQVGVDFEHEGEAVCELRAGIVLDDDLQKALGIDLGMEFLLTETHVPGESEWEAVKSGEWMHSIAGTFFYEVD